MHSVWYSWLQGSTRSRSSGTYSPRQIEHRSSVIEEGAGSAKVSLAVCSDVIGIVKELEGSTGVFCIIAVVNVGI